MLKTKFSLLILLFISMNVSAQKFNRSLNKDSLLNEGIKLLPIEGRTEFLARYKAGSEEVKEFFLLMLLMPRSSKAQLIQNIDSNYQNVANLKSVYQRLVPTGFDVSIEFNPADKLISMPESIDLRISYKKETEKIVKQEWNLPYRSPILDKLLALLKWNNDTLVVIKKLLDAAKCTSISNGKLTTIGFARSGMGKYSYLLFDAKLTTEQVKEYNDGCTHIYHRDNIVLVYGGGAIGPQCFPD